MMKIFNILIVTFLLLAFPAHGISKEMSAEKVAKKTKLNKDESDDTLDFRGPKIRSFGEDPIYMRSFMDSRIGVVVHFIIVEYDFLKAKGSSSGDIIRTADSLFKKFYISDDRKGNEFTTKVFHTDVGCSDGNSFCDFEEYFRITIPDTYLRDHQETGLKVYARSQAGPSYEVEIYPAYIQGILLRLQQERDKRGIPPIN